MRQVDVIVIGAGPGGAEIAAAEAARGSRVVLIERDAHAGGTCLNRGCIPTKALCAAAATLRTVAAASAFGITVDGLRADYGTAHRRAVDVVATLRADLVGALTGVERLHGEARLAPGPSVMVADEIITAPKVFIATGSRPAALKVPGAEHIIDSDTFLALDKLPASAVVIGGGVIGLEFASIMNAYGTAVTVVEYCPEILPGFDAELAKRLRTQMSRGGVVFKTGASVQSVERVADEFRVNFKTSKGDFQAEAAMVLGAVGRRPVVPDGYADVGIELDKRGFIVVDERMQTSAKGFYAVGDVNGRSMLAHSAAAQARRAMESDVDLETIPAIVFTTPELAGVGLTADAAAAAGMAVRTVKVPYSACGKAVADGVDAGGLLKLTVDEESGVILGCHVLGTHAADLVAEAAAAIHYRATAADMAQRIVHAHPSLSELLSIASARV